MTPPANTPPDAAAVMAQVQAIISELEVDSLDQLGSVHLRPAEDNRPISIAAGVHLLRPGTGSSFAALPAPTGWNALKLDLGGRFAASSADGENGPDASLIRYQNAQLVDTAVILAKEIVLDGEVLVLSDNITQFILVAETIRSSNGAKITWFGAGTAADVRPIPNQAPDGVPTFDPDDADENATFSRRNAGDGQDGVNGLTGNPGNSAPDVILYVRELTLEPNTTSSGHSYEVSLPDIDLRGQTGGQGQVGQQGGDGGDGAKGLNSKNGPLPGECKRGPGYGGHGGDGGDGGDGGQGGIGGSGGEIIVNYVVSPADTNLQAAEFLTSGGDGGLGGAGGLGGNGGEGGEAGNNTSKCSARPDRRGDDGRDGGVGSPGAAGVAGTNGDVKFQTITQAEWEQAFTKPYLVRAEDARVTETIVFETTNISGTASLLAVDDLDGSTHDFLLELVEEGKYAWSIPEDMEASTYTVTILRGHDSELTNTYRVEVLPRIDEVRFQDSYDARPGGTAYVVGLGLRDDVEVIYDGIRIEPDQFQDQTSLSALGLDVNPSVVRDVIRFTIPVTATDGQYFSRDDGEMAHTLHLDQPFPLADSDAATLTLLRTDGMAFLPSANGFDFENNDMFQAAEEYVTQDGALGGLFGDDGLGGRAYELFRETYGAGEVDDAGGHLSPVVWANYGLWYSYYAGTGLGTGSCFSLSAIALRDFFNDIPSQNDKTIGQLVRGVPIIHGRQFSDEILRLQVAESLLDAASAAVGSPSMTEITVRYIAGFLQQAEDGDGQRYAPIMMFVPSAGAYGEVLVQAANLIGETVNLWDGISPQESWDDLDEAYHTMVQAFKRSHAVTPYRVVYDDPSDSLPSRIYFYENNAPDDDEIYLDIYREGGRVEFNYVGGDHSSDNGFMLGVVPVGMPLDNVDLLFDEDVLWPNANSVAVGIVDTVLTMLDAARFIGPLSGSAGGSVGEGTDPGTEVQPPGSTDGSPLTGDYNANGLVEQGDLDLVLLNWGREAETLQFGTVGGPSGLIDQEELDAVLLHWGEQKIASQPPLPAPLNETPLGIGFAASHLSTSRDLYLENSTSGPLKLGDELLGILAEHRLGSVVGNAS